MVLGDFQVSITAFYRPTQGWTQLFQKPCTTMLFSHRSLNPLLNSRSNTKKHRRSAVYLSPLPITTEAFNFPPCPLRAQLEIDISDLSSMTTVTCRTGGVMGRGLHFNRNFWLSTCLVSCSCHTRGVTNADFKLCRSQQDSHTARRKVESSGSEAEIVQIVVERRKISWSQLEKGTSGLCFFALEGKIKQGVQISTRKWPYSAGLLKPLSATFTAYFNHWRPFHSYILIRILLNLNCILFDKTLPPKIKDCQVVQTRISREHGGRDHKTELQVGGVAETQLYKVKTAEA